MQTEWMNATSTRDIPLVMFGRDHQIKVVRTGATSWKITGTLQRDPVRVVSTPEPILTEAK